MNHKIGRVDHLNSTMIFWHEFFQMLSSKVGKPMDNHISEILNGWSNNYAG